MQDKKPTVADIQMLHGAVQVLEDETKGSEEAIAVAQRMMQMFVANQLDPIEPADLSDIYGFAETEARECATVLNGVYHDDKAKAAVASDGQIIVSMPSAYDPDKAGKIVRRDGSEILGAYPDMTPLIKGFDESPKEVTLYDLAPEELSYRMNMALANYLLNPWLYSHGSPVALVGKLANVGIGVGKSGVEIIAAAGNEAWEGQPHAIRKTLPDGTTVYIQIKKIDLN